MTQLTAIDCSAYCDMHCLVRADGLAITENRREFSLSFVVNCPLEEFKRRFANVLAGCWEATEFKPDYVLQLTY